MTYGLATIMYVLQTIDRGQTDDTIVYLRLDLTSAKIKTTS